MSTWRRFGVAILWTVGTMIGGLIYNEVFVAELLPLVETDGPFGTPVVWLETLVPVILLALLLAVWAWTIAGAFQEERRVDARRVRR